MTTESSSTVFEAEAAALTETVAREPDPIVVWRQAEKSFNAVIGHRLFTVLQHHATRGEVERAYSSRPDVYPVKGSKAMGPTPWGDLVLKRGQPFVGADAEAIRWAFPDHETIFGMGLGSALNLPLCLGGHTLGTLALLHQAGHHHAGQVRRGMIMAGLLVPVLAEMVAKR